MLRGAGIKVLKISKLNNIGNEENVPMLQEQKKITRISNKNKLL
jgi:myo-inositol-1-phosphate synthase